VWWRLFGTVFVVSLACLLGVERETSAQPQAVTFTRQIAPLIFEHCVGCHHPDGPAPFSLATYADVRPRARLIASVTEKRLMPPWKSVPGYGEFIGHRHLAGQQIGLIRQWVADGAPEGDPRDLPQPPTWSGGWRFGTPDMVVTTPAPYVVRGDGADYSRTFVFPVPIQRVRYVKGFEFDPSDSFVVHHANIRIDPTPASRKLDEQDPAPGYEGLLLASAVYPDGYFLGWTPGQVSPLLPNGLAWRLDPGTDLVVEMHFVPNGRPRSVQPSIALYFTDDPPQRTPAMLRLGRQDIDIAPGRGDYVSTDSFVLPVDVDVIAVQPHAHYRARQIQAAAALPDGRRVPLILIDDWDYHWQHVYQYVKAPHLPKGTILSMQWVFDNSVANRRNPRRPPVRVQWGQQSTDEMGDLWIQMLTEDAHDLRVLNERIHPKHVAEEIVGYEMRIRQDPGDVSLHNDVALLYKESGRLDQTVVHFASVVRLRPESAAAHYNLATALVSDNRPRDAIDELREALRIDPDYVGAHNNLGGALVKVGNRPEAVAQFREAIRLDPTDPDAYYNMGLISLADNNGSEAVRWFREALAHGADTIEVLTRLSWQLATAPSLLPGTAEEAMHLAERAAAKTNYQDVAVLDVVAAAEAAAGRFDQAVTTCTAALALEPDEALASPIRARQALFKAHRRYIVRPSSH
jgi:Flp pilus assembly protein TadD